MVETSRSSRERERERERERCYGDPFKTPSEEEEEDAEDIVEKSKSSPEKLVEFPADINRLKLPKLNIAVFLKKATTAKASVDIIGKLWGVEKGRKGAAGGAGGGGGGGEDNLTETFLDNRFGIFHYLRGIYPKNRHFNP
ncbi:hypothetical protein RUM43_010047 [Polyplax serrata]|uniref:Uncharacterized protein n=1 Tax=Polyplax serrata TaxID=468196 RepID=A0AAN8S038_POLSC